MLATPLVPSIQSLILRSATDFRRRCEGVETTLGIERYRDDPAGFARDVLGHDPWDVPNQMMAAIATPRARVAVKACHSSAKTFTASEIVLWWVAAVGGICVTTAPTWFQVKTLLWGEIRSGHRLSAVELPGTPLQAEYRLGDKTYAIGLSTNEGVRFQGFHGDVLVVLDEAPGVRPDIYEAIEGIRAGGDVRVLAVGNPTIASGPFYDAFSKDRSGWRTFTIDALDTPNLRIDERPATIADVRAWTDADLDHAPRPYLTTRRWVREKLEEWGEDSPLWQARVRGQFPDQAEDALISLSWIERASIPRGAPALILPDNVPLVAGIDVAGPGEDETVVYLRTVGLEREIVAGPWVWSTPDPRGAVAALLRTYTNRLQWVNVDSAGMGHFFAAHLTDLGFTVNPINVGKAPVGGKSNADQFVNLKAQLYWALRLAFDQGTITGLHDERTAAQLTGIRYAQDSRGRLTIESKDAARKRGVTSPDRAEALMLAFAPNGFDFGERATESDVAAALIGLPDYGYDDGLGGSAW